MKYSELEKILRAAGCYPSHEGGSHRLWYSPVTGEFFPVGHHKTQEVPKGTLKNILRAAGLENRK